MERNAARALEEADASLMFYFINISCEGAPTEEAAQLLMEG
jgi:hypothetical protein